MDTSSEPGEVTVGAVQLETQDNLAENLERAEQAIASAARRGATLVLLPENFAFMGAEEARREIAEALPAVEVREGGDAQPSRPSGEGPILQMLRRAAKNHAIWVIGGGLPERSSEPARPFNTSVVVGPTGAVEAIYRKIHLFDVDVGDGTVYRESSATTPGDRAVVTRAAGLGVGLSVCYDLRFPELYRALADRGADLATVPAAFTLMTGKDHWHVLLRARAIESQMFVVAAAQYGLHPRGRRTYGKSCIIDPWGDVIAQCSDGPGVVVAPIARARLTSVRKSLPSLAHRRPIG
ncbi:MAG: carbon-nitrogen hydrolase family protein [Polyangiaceae bacterium]